MVSLKQGTVSYKNRKITSKPEENWIRAENTHDPIIEKEIWNCVRDIESSRYRPRKKSDGSVSIFSGMLYCSACGFKMRSSTQKKFRKNGSQYIYNTFLCGTYSRSGKHACSAHVVGENKLHKIVLGQIQSHAKIVISNEALMTECISKKLYGETSLNKEKLNKIFGECKTQLDSVETLIDKLYEDHVYKNISETIFRKLMEKYGYEYKECEQKIQNLEKEIRNACLNESSIEKWVSQIKQYVEVENLNTKILISLIERIVISDVLKDSQNAEENITVIYRYVGDLSWLKFDEDEI